jgi:hypothetical protein
MRLGTNHRTTPPIHQWAFRLCLLLPCRLLLRLTCQPPLDTPKARPANGSTTVTLTVVYGSCSQVWAAGQKSVGAGERRFNPALDTDGDGVACDK